VTSVDWSRYLRCNTCLAPTGQPCWSLRVEHGRRNITKWPHQRRDKKKILSEPGSPYQKMVDAWAHMARVTQRVSATLNLRRSPADVCGVLGGSWIADEAYSTGLYFAVKYVTDPVLAISMAARTSGDSDSIACIAGAITGAAAGERHAWPELWRYRIERRDELETLIDQMWQRWQ
jgi:ADP-ribosylglycohydrolase